MANSFYNEGLQFYLEATAAFSTDASLKVALMDDEYVPAKTDANWSTISAHQVSLAPVALPTKSDANGVATGGTTTFTGIAGSLDINTIVLFHDLGGGNGKLICWWDTGTGLPLVTTGADVKVEWNGTDPTGLMFSL